VTVDDPEYSSVLALSRFRRSRKIEAAFELSYQSGERLCFAQNLFFGMTQAPFQAHFLTSLGPKKPGQVIVPPITSPVKAVRAAIVQEHKSK
jgi:hypothetical protein